MRDKQTILQNILEESIDGKKIFGTTFCIKYKGEDWCGASGNLESEDQYFIASTAKLFVTVVILNFVSKGVLDIDHHINKFLDNEVMECLHTIKGQDFAKTITVKQLLAHTSGVPDYFQQKNKQGNSLESEIINGQDQYWTFERAIALSKSHKPLFAPNAREKAHYSDTNFQLLGKIIENISNKSLSAVYKELIFDPLGLTKTYLYEDASDARPKPLYYRRKELFIPKAMASFGADGGIVSTSREMMIFLEAFFCGRLFPKSYIDTLKVWNRIFFPMQSGIGIHKFKLFWIFNPLGTIPELIGHSGLSGALAFHSPEKDLYITGTVNQVAYPDTSFRLAIKLIQKVLVK